MLNQAMGSTRKISLALDMGALTDEQLQPEM